MTWGSRRRGKEKLSVDSDLAELHNNVGFGLAGCEVAAKFHKVAFSSHKATLGAKKEAN